MLHLDVVAYAISFFIFTAGLFFYLKKNVMTFLQQKKKSFDDFFVTSHYLQNISLTYIMQEKENDEDIVLDRIKQNTKDEIEKMEEKSLEEMRLQIQKLRSEFLYKMKILNSRFINDTKAKIVEYLMDKVKVSMRKA